MKISSTCFVSFAFALAIAGCSSFSPVSEAADASATPDGGTSDSGGTGNGGALPKVGPPAVIGGADFPQAVGVAVTGDTIFISTGAAIYSRSKSDSEKTFGTPFVGNLNGTNYVTADETRLFWVEFGAKTVSRIRQNGSDGVTVITASTAPLTSPAGVAVTVDRAWVTDYGGNRLFSVPKEANGADIAWADVTFSGQNPEGIVAVGTTLYIALNSAGRIVAVDSTNPIAATTVVEAPGVAGIAYDEKTNALYFTSQVEPYGVDRWRPGMAKPERVAGGDSLPLGIAVDDSNIYWITHDQFAAKLWRASK